MMKNHILYIALLITSMGHSQKGTFTLGGGSSLMVSGISNKNFGTESGFGCCANEKYEAPSHISYQPNYQKKFLMFSYSDMDIIPYLEMRYYPIDRLKIILNTFGFERTTKFEAGRYYGPTTYTQSYGVSYHEEALRFGVGVGASYDILNFSDKHSISVGVLSSFDKVLQRKVIENYGVFKSYAGADQQEIKASEIFPPFTGTNYLLFAMLDYEFKFTAHWSAMTRFRFNPKLDFTRNCNRGSYKGTRPVYRSILAFDLQLVYRFGEKKSK